MLPGATFVATECPAANSPQLAFLPRFVAIRVEESRPRLDTCCATATRSARGTKLLAVAIAPMSARAKGSSPWNPRTERLGERKLDPRGRDASCVLRQTPNW